MRDVHEEDHVVTTMTDRLIDRQRLLQIDRQTETQTHNTHNKVVQGECE